MTNFSQTELMFLLNSIMDLNNRNSNSLVKFPDNKTLADKVALGRQLQEKIAIAYADSFKGLN